MYLFIVVVKGSFNYRDENYEYNAQNKTETEAQTLAIDAFKQKATELSKNFGFAGYTLREVSVNANDGGPIRPRMMAASAKSFSADAQVPIEAGKTSVVVNVSGSVQLK